MLIRFTGPRTRRRLWGPYEFSRFEGMVQEVDAETAAAMLTHPGDEFEVDEGELLLLLEGVDANMAGLLAFEGIGSAADMAGLTTREAARVARALGRDVTRKMVEDWVNEAQGIDEVDLELEALGLVKRGCCG